MLTHINTSAILFWLRFSDDYVVNLVWLSTCTFGIQHCALYSGIVYRIASHGIITFRIMDKCCMSMYIIYGWNVVVSESFFKLFRIQVHTTRYIEEIFCFFYFCSIHFIFFAFKSKQQMMLYSSTNMCSCHTFRWYFQWISFYLTSLFHQITNWFNFEMLCCRGKVRHSIQTRYMFTLCDNYPIECRIL